MPAAEQRVRHTLGDFLRIGWDLDKFRAHSQTVLFSKIAQGLIGLFKFVIHYCSFATERPLSSLHCTSALGHRLLFRSIRAALASALRA